MSTMLGILNWRHFSSRLLIYTSQYLFYALVNVVRFLDIRIGVLHDEASCRPARTIELASSKDSTRKIRVDVYEPSGLSNEKRRPLPVHVNFHGSGFVLPCHGSDAELCAYICTRLGCIVLDADYAKGPVNPYPAAIDDAVDVFSYVASRPGMFDVSKVSVGGFSAGANVAILAALRIAKESSSPSSSSTLQQPLRSIIAWYPPTNLSRRGDEQKESSVWSWVHRQYRSCYLPEGIDRSDPRVSPLFADSKLFPPTTLIVGEDDKLLVDSVELSKKLNADGVDCVLYTIPGAAHAWERFVKKDTPLWAARDKALQLTETRLRQAYDTTTHTPSHPNGNGHLQSEDDDDGCRSM